MAPNWNFSDDWNFEILQRVVFLAIAGTQHDGWFIWVSVPKDACQTVNCERGDTSNFVAKMIFYYPRRRRVSLLFRPLIWVSGLFSKQSRPSLVVLSEAVSFNPLDLTSFKSVVPLTHGRPRYLQHSEPPHCSSQNPPPSHELFINNASFHSFSLANSLISHRFRLGLSLSGHSWFRKIFVYQFE